MKIATFLNKIIAKYYLKDERMKNILDIQMPTLKIMFAEGLNEIAYKLKFLKINNLNTIDIEVCNTCNLKCTICPVNTNIMKREKGYMSFSLFKQIIDANKNIKRIRFSLWGEPLLNKNLIKFIQYAKQKTKAHLLFYSNGTLFNDKIARKILTSGLDTIVFSMDGIEKTYEKIRGFPYETLKKNVLAFSQLRNELNEKFKIHIQAVGTPEVIENMDAFLNDWKKTGIDSAEVMSYTPYKNRGKTNHKTRCRFLWRGYLAITWNGDVTVCCTDFDNILSPGNVKDVNFKLSKFINSKKLIALRKLHLKNVFPKPCSTCYEYTTEKTATRFKR